MAFDPTRGYHDNPLSLQTYGDTRAEINLISPIPILLRIYESKYIYQIPILLVKIPPLDKSRTDAGGSVLSRDNRDLKIRGWWMSTTAGESLNACLPTTGSRSP